MGTQSVAVSNRSAPHARRRGFPYPGVLRSRRIILGSLLFASAVSLNSQAKDYPFITVASTTSTEQSGLLGYLLPAFTQTTGIDVYVVAVGTGEALKIGEDGDCDVVLVHDKARELQFMQNGFGSVRHEVMYNDFVIVGPKDDPAKINATHDAVAALRKISAVKARFVSRGDMSGYGRRRTALVDRGRRSADSGSRPLVFKSRLGHGTDADHRSVDKWLCADGSRHLGSLPRSPQSGNSRRPRSSPLQPVLSHPGEPGTASQSKGRFGYGVHRLAHLAAGSRYNCRL